MDNVEKSVGIAEGIIESGKGELDYLDENKREFWMEDVADICAKTCDLVQIKLNQFGLKLSDEQEDRIFNEVQKVLEEVSNGNYKSYN